jgi:hypothetical protein
VVFIAHRCDGVEVGGNTDSSVAAHARVLCRVAAR